METHLRLVVHWKKFVYDDLLVTSTNVTHIIRKQLVDDAKSKRVIFYVPKHLNDRRINSYAVSAYVYYLDKSHVYRRHAIQPLFIYAAEEGENVILIKLRKPKKEFLDYRWGERAARMALEKCEVDHAMSWLSTLGGAFSALGEQFQYCAQMAGKVSIHQFRLALRLGDPLLVARCKLYAALSMIQQENLRVPKLMIRDLYEFAVDQRDSHLQRMCQGVWAKLKYSYKLRKQRRKKLCA